LPCGQRSARVSGGNTAIPLGLEKWLTVQPASPLVSKPPLLKIALLVEGLENALKTEMTIATEVRMARTDHAARRRYYPVARRERG
jgi:hypothetical protein